jgi:hypothetical protein
MSGIIGDLFDEKFQDASRKNRSHERIAPSIESPSNRAMVTVVAVR